MVNLDEEEKRVVELDGFWVPRIEKHRYSALGRFEGIPDQDVRKLKKVIDLVSRRTCALDIGGNIGTTATLLARYFSSVEAFEPAPDLFVALSKNLASHVNATPRQCAIGEEAGEVYLTQYVTHGQLSHLSTGKAIDDVETRKVGPIPLRTVDSFGFVDVSFIKIDVEGFEGPVVRGAENTIRRFRPAILVEQAGNEQKFFGLPRNEAADHLRSLGMIEHPSPPKMSKDMFFVFPEQVA